jgi:hypothetical protein
MLADAGANQLDLFQEYLRTCRRMAGAVLALDREVVMLNEFARTTLTPGDQTAMLAQAGEALTAGYRGPIVIELPTGRRARMHCRPVGHGEHPSGIVVHVKLDEPAGRHIARTVTDVANPLPGLVGTAPPWLRACHEVERLFKAADAHGLRVKLHAEQLSNQNGAALAAKYKALSADHLEHLDEAGAKAMAKAGTVAVLLPGAFYALQESRKPPVDLLRRHKVPIAIATDCNPGTSPMLSPTLAMNMACTLFGLTPEEALAGMTINAARALGLAHEVGSIVAGKAADLCIWRIESPAELGYWIGLPGPERRIFGGRDD